MKNGYGILCAGLDVKVGEENNFHKWHTCEHMVERLGLSGFVTGRRFSRRDSPKYLILYEVEDLSVLSSSDYIACLNNPTPWTQEVMEAFQNGFRSAHQVVASAGGAEGGFVLTLRFSPNDLDKAKREISKAVSEKMLLAPGITRIHFGLPNQHASTIDTVESRESGNVFLDEWLLLVEGISEESLNVMLNTEFSGDRLRAWGVEAQPTADIYQLQARVGRED